MGLRLADISRMGFDSAFLYRDEKLEMMAKAKQEIVALESEGAAT